VSCLPNGWTKSFLTDLLAPLSDGRIIHQGWSPQCESEPSPSDEIWGVLKTTSIQDGKFLSEHNKRLPLSLEPRPILEVKKGDILITCAGPRIRCGVPCFVRKTRPNLIISGKMYRIRANEEFADPRFIESFLRSPMAQVEIDGMKTGMSESGMNLTHARFAKLEMPIPPFNEQKRIADKLEQLLSFVESCKSRLESIPGIIKRFRQSIVSSAVLGRLTEEWCAQQPESENKWITSSLGELCKANRVITYGVIKLGNEIPDGVPCLRTSNVRWLRIETEGMKRIAPSISTEFSRTILQGAEVLVNVRGTLGGVAVATSDMKGWNVSREVAVIPVDTSLVDPKFIALCVASDSSQRWLREVERGVAYVGINLEDLRTLPVKIPPLDEQSEIVRRVEDMFAIADNLEAQYQTARGQVEHLTQSLLSKAFRGELVLQDPNDEPAEKMLERIRAANACEVIKPKRKAPGRKPMMTKITPEALKIAIRRLPNDTFTFDELRNSLPGDYELLKDTVFALLSESDPLIQQIFFAEAKSIQFKRV